MIRAATTRLLRCRRLCTQYDGKGVEAAGRILGIGGGPGRYEFDRFHSLQDFLQEDTQNHPSQRSGGADMDASSKEEVLRRIAIESKVVWLGKHAGVSIGGDPNQREPRPSLQLAPAEFDRARGNPPVGNERTVNAQDFVDGGNERFRLAA